MQTKYLQQSALLTLLFLIHTFAQSQQLEDFKIIDKSRQFSTTATKNDIQFNGYTNYWHDNYTTWLRYGNLYKMAIPDVEKSILQSKVDVAEDMDVPGLIMQEGFLNYLLSVFVLW